MCIDQVSVPGLLFAKTQKIVLSKVLIKYTCLIKRLSQANFLGVHPLFESAPFNILISDLIRCIVMSALYLSKSRVQK